MSQVINKTKTFWSNSLVARLYRRFSGKYFEKMHKAVANHILAQKSRSILDIACGPGDFLSYVQKNNRNIQISGTDVAPGMVAYAKSKLGVSDIMEASAEAQPFQDKSFDSVTVMMAFHHFPQQMESLKEIKRILKNDGVCYVADIVASSDFRKRLFNFFEKLTGVRGHTEHYTELDFSGLAREAGFRSVVSESVPDMTKIYKIFIIKSN